MTTRARLDVSVSALTTELIKIPELAADSAAHLDPVRLAITRAVATGQSADDLARQLSIPTGWGDIDLSQPPPIPGAAPGAAAAKSKAKSRAAVAIPTAPIRVQPIVAPPAKWISATITIALKQPVNTRVVVLDREPTALGGLELPGWARALKPSAVYGPVMATSTGPQVQTQKWIIIYSFTETVQFVRNGTVLCVLPLSSLHLAAPKQAAILAGSAWIAAQPFVNTVPANSFAGLTIQSGQITSDQPLVLNSTTVTVPANATVSLSLIPAATPAGPVNFPSKVTAPGKITVNFPPTGPATIAFDKCAASIYSETIQSVGGTGPALYNAQLKLLYIPGTSSQPIFQPKPTTGKLLNLTGSAPITTAGWALSVSESTTPANFGSAINSGDFALAFGKGISCNWPGASRPEPAIAGNVIAQNGTLVIGAISGSPHGVLLKQKFNLWADQDSNTKSPRPCQLLSGRAAGQALLYALAGTAEILELGAALEALVDRPLLATGARVPAIFLEAIIALVSNNSKNALLVYSAAPLPLNGPNQPPAAFPLALDNALLDVSQPVAMLLIAKADANFNVTDGLCLFVFGYLLVELFLPDPYTGGLTNGASGPVRVAGDSSYNSAGAGYLAAEVIWNATGKVDLRLADMAHDHPAAAPSTEAETAAVQPLPKYIPYPVNFPYPILDTTDPIVIATPVTPIKTTTPLAPIQVTDIGTIGKVGLMGPIQTVGIIAAPTPVDTIQKIGTLRPTAPITKLVNKAATTKKGKAIAKPHQQKTPTFIPSEPLPPTPAGATFLDLSTRASQLGVEVVTNPRYATFYTIDGLSVRGPAALLPLTTLPAIAWEPMYNKSNGDASVDDNELMHPPNDGPLTQVRSNSATLIPISPLQSLQSVLDAGQGGFEANLTLPFGMIGFLDSSTENGTLLPNVNLVQPVFPETSTPTGSIYTGAWQLSVTSPSTKPDAVLAGRTYLRTQADNPDVPGFSYGEQVLGVDVADIFMSRFNPADSTLPGSTGVPLRRYDLTGYGATTFSEWSNITNPAPTDVIKAFFHVLIGRTSHEVIQVQSVVYPWAIKVVRTITIDRLASGAIERYDSGWQAASDGTFNFPSATGITRDQTHSGLISGVINVRNIQQLGLPIDAAGTQDNTGFGGVDPNPANIPVQPVTFDADVIIQPQHLVVQGGSTQKDLAGVSHTCVPSKGITGYIGLGYKYHLSLSDMAALPALKAGAGGPISATIEVGKASSMLRATEFDALIVNDTATNKIGIACAVRGLPKLSSDGSWSVAARKQTDAAPVSLGANTAAPLVQPNKAPGSSTPGTDIHYADPADIFRLASNSPTPPATLYGFLQATGTQSNFLSRPILTYNSNKLKLGDALNVAHAGALLGAISKFPGISQCLQFLGSELDKITNQVAAPSLNTTQNLQLKPSVRSTPITLIDISIAKVALYFHWKDDDLSVAAKPPSVVISLGAPVDPSWSLDVNHIAVALIIPALSDKPVMWLQGGFHADADNPPAFPDLKVVFDGPLSPLTDFFTILEDIASVLSPGSSSNAIKAHADDDNDGGAGLKVHFADGKLAVTDNFSLPDLPLGPGTISDVSLDIGATLDILGLAVGFMVSIGTKDTPCHWIVDPLSGTVAVGAGIKNNEIDIFIEGGIGLGLAIDLGIASGSASITLSVSVEINGSKITIMVVLTGQAQVDVLGGLASASITLSAGLGLEFATDVLPPPDVNLIGTASVGIHISICWIININFSGSWTFQKDVPLAHPALSS